MAGRFYPADPGRLSEAVEHLMVGEAVPQRAVVAIGPHAGYVYSGSILGQTYARVEVPERVIVMCPNHTGLGVRRSLWSGGAWRLPTGEIRIDETLARLCLTHAHLQPDRQAHRHEHAIEVHLPFLLARNPGVRIVPVVLADLDVDACREVGEGLARAVRQGGGDVLIAASTDMSHYLSAEAARAKDQLALERIQAMDPEGLHRTVREHDISMCGYVPTTCALFAARSLGASSATLVRYGTSGDASGDFDRVVGYAGLTVR